MGRPERPLDPSAGPVQRFAVELRLLRQSAGRMSYRELSRRAHYSVTALSEAAGGGALPSLTVALAYAEACGGNRNEWEARWHAAAEESAALEAGNSASETLGAKDEVKAESAPYLGLETYGPSDAGRLFGRRALTEELCRRLSDTSFLVVFGPSGSGKSSLLRAGLLPALWDGKTVPGSRDWPTLLLTPGEHPVDRLATRLADLSGMSAKTLRDELMIEPESIRRAIGRALADRPETAALVILVDQVEEIFTLCRDETERACVLAGLLAAAGESRGRARVVLGMRADFYARCAEYPALVAALQDRQVLIGAMDEDDLRQVIVAPAAAARLRVETALVETVLGEARGEPGALPLVSHALLETWRRRRCGSMSLAGYRDAGGVQGAIAQTAERVHSAFDPARRRVVRDIFLRLTALGEGTEDTRRRVRTAELVDGPDGAAAAEVLCRLTAARLLTIDAEGVQVAHEAIIRCWPRLREWLTEDRKRLHEHRRLTEAAREWDDNRRDDALLYRGPRLSAWTGEHSERLNKLEHAFLRASRDREARERTATRRRARRTLFGIASAAVAVSVLAAVAFVQAAATAKERDLAVSRELAATARAQSQLDPELALLLARRAFAVRRTDETEAVLRQATLDSRVRGILSLGRYGKVSGAAFSPDGRYLVTGSEDGTARVWRTAGQGVSASAPVVLRGHHAAVWTPVFSPNGRRLATASTDGTIRLWNWRDGGTSTVYGGFHGEAWGVAFSPDGRWLAGAGADGTIRVWNTSKHTAPILLRGHEGRVLTVAFSPDGRRLASGGGDHTVRLWDWAEHTPTAVLGRHDDSVENVAFSPDGRRLASASTDGTLRVWATYGRTQPLILRGHDGTVEGTAFSPDGRRIASVGNDGTARIWNVGSAIDPLILRGHRGTIWSAAFAPDGRTLATAGDDGTAQTWDITGAGAPVTLRGATGPVWDAALGPGGRTVAGAGQDGSVRIWNSDGGGATVTLPGHGGELYGVSISPDGSRVAAAGEDGAVRVWPARGGPPVVLRGHRGKAWTASFSPDGRRLVSAGNDGTVRVWSLDGGSPIILRGHRGEVRYAVFGPDGRHVASAGNDGTVRVWDLRTGGAVVLRGHQGLVFAVVFAPDGRHVASAGNDGTVRVWKATGDTRPLVLRGHQGLVWGIAYSPDGRHLATTGNDNTVRVWRADRADEPVVFRGHGASVESVRFGPGDRLVTSHGDGTVRVWRCVVCGPIDQVAALARARSVQNL